MNKLIEKIKKNMKIWSQRYGSIEELLGNIADSMEKKVSAVKQDLELEPGEHKLADIKT